jgi:hypothetical protein
MAREIKDAAAARSRTRDVLKMSSKLVGVAVETARRAALDELTDGVDVDRPAAADPPRGHHPVITVDQSGVRSMNGELMNGIQWRSIGCPVAVRSSTASNSLHDKGFAPLIGHAHWMGRRRDLLAVRSPTGNPAIGCSDATDPLSA